MGYMEEREDEGSRLEEENAEAIERKGEWLAHECTETLRRGLVERRAQTLQRLLSVAKSSTDPDVREYGCRLHELDNLIIQAGLKGLADQ
jgi:hypothetical protein